MTITRVDSFHFHPGMKDYVLALKRVDPAGTPWTPLEKPLAECTVTLVSSAAIHRKGDTPFDLERERCEPTWGDPTHREIPRSAGQDDTAYTHLHIDTSYLEQDRNVAWPVDIFEDYGREGRIGRLADTLYSIMGYIPNFHPLVKKTAPALIARMKEEEVDAAFLIPVWPICPRSVGLLQREIEKAGIATVSVSNVPEITERVAVPRAVFVQHPFGRVLGDVGDRAGQRRVCDAALESLESADSPNHHRHLPYAWPESPEKVKWRPDVPPPLGSYVRQGKLDLAETVVRALRDEEREG